VKGSIMVKRRSSRSAAVLEAFLGLSNNQQWMVIREAHDRGRNAIAALIEDLRGQVDSLSVDGLIADHGRLVAEFKLKKRQRPANLKRSAEIVRLKDVEGLSHGQIGQRLGMTYDATRKAYARGKKRFIKRR
jgi:Sigma-70, region 4